MYTERVNMNMQSTAENKQMLQYLDDQMKIIASVCKKLNQDVVVSANSIWVVTFFVFVCFWFRM